MWENMESATVIIGLLVLTRNNVIRCRTCLTQRIGVMRIELVGEEKKSGIYLIKGPITILNSFFIECNTREVRLLQTDVKKSGFHLAPLLQRSVLQHGILSFQQK